MLSKLFYPFQLLWRAWFYVAVFISILLVFPFITLFSLNERFYPLFFSFARVWGYSVLLLTGFYPWVINRKVIDPRAKYIIIANHTSMVDIMLTYVAVPNTFKFIGKVELAKIPVFGYYYRRTNILVDRSKLSSKRDVYFSARKALNNNVSVCIYPEGGVPVDRTVHLAPFKIGAFRLAIEEGVSVLPIAFPDNKRRHPYDFLAGGTPGMLRARVFPPISPQGKNEKELRDQCYAVLDGQLAR